MNSNSNEFKSRFIISILIFNFSQKINNPQLYLTLKNPDVLMLTTANAYIILL